MGTTKSRESIMVQVPVESKHKGANDFTSHHVHSGTLKSAIVVMLFVILLIALSIMICKNIMTRMQVQSNSVPIVHT